MALLDRLLIQNILYNMDTYRLFFKSMLNIVEKNDIEWVVRHACLEMGNKSNNLINSRKKDNHEC